MVECTGVLLRRSLCEAAHAASRTHTQTHTSSYLNLIVNHPRAGDEGEGEFRIVRHRYGTGRRHLRLLRRLLTVNGGVGGRGERTGNWDFGVCLPCVGEVPIGRKGKGSSFGWRCV